MALDRRNFLRIAGYSALGTAAGLPGLFSAQAEASPIPYPKPRVRAHLVYEHGTGQVLSLKNEHEPVNPASLTKLLIAAAFYDAMKHDQLTSSDRVVDRRERDVRDLLITSDNDAAARVAEFLTLQEAVREEARRRRDVKAGTQWAFTRLIGEPMIEDLGMEKTAFWNASGLPGPYTDTPPNVTTAAALVPLCNHILDNHPEILQTCAQPYLDPERKRGRNTNPLLESAEHDGAAPYAGVDGLKTGYIDAAGFNLIATAQRYGRRIVVISIGNQTPQARIENVTSLLDLGFAKLQWRYSPPHLKPWDFPASSLA